MYVVFTELLYHILSQPPHNTYKQKKASWSKSTHLFSVLDGFHVKDNFLILDYIVICKLLM